MVNRQHRDLLADAVHGLLAGYLSNYDFDEWLHAHQFIRRGDGTTNVDNVLAAIMDRAWCLYSDTPEYRLVGSNRLAFDTRREVLRWILFLRSDLEYEWPPFEIINPVFQPLTLSLFLLWLFTLGIGPGIQQRRQFREWSRAGNLAVWPFRGELEYDVTYRRQCPFTSLLVG